MVGLPELIQNTRQFDLILTWLLQGLWIAGILPILIASIPSSRLAFFRQLVLGFARRGKISPSQRFTVPHKFFLHFYIFSVAWTTSLLAMTWHYAYKVAPSKFETWGVSGGASSFSSLRFGSLSRTEGLSVWRSVFLLCLMEIQVLRRLYETLYVFKYSRSARMHIFAYLTGYYFYFAVPVSLIHGRAIEVLNFAVHQMSEFYVIGDERMAGIEFTFWGCFEPFTKLGLYTWAGAAIFYWGWIHQQKCHAIFGSQRQDIKDQDKHVILLGDWFDYVSSPHYLAEMVIYAGIVIASGGLDLTIWLGFAFTVANLTFAAGESHRWYLEKFEDYPPDRKAVIPFIY